MTTRDAECDAVTLGHDIPGPVMTALRDRIAEDLGGRPEPEVAEAFVAELPSGAVVVQVRFASALEPLAATVVDGDVIAFWSGQGSADEVREALGAGLGSEARLLDCIEVAWFVP